MRSQFGFSRSTQFVWLATSAVIACGISFSAEAREARYKDYPLDLKSGDRLSVQVLRGMIRIVPVATGKEPMLHVKKGIKDAGASAQQLAMFDQMIFTVKRDGNLVTVGFKGPETPEAVAEWMKPGSPELTLELEVPNVPLELSARDGQIAVQDFQESIRASIVNGTIKTSNTVGELAASAQRGEIRVENQKGHTEIDSYAAKTTLVKVDGDVSITNYGSETALASVKGAIEMRSTSGAVNVAKSGGSIDFTSGRGAVVISEFEGPVQGETDLGNVAVSILGEADVSIESNQAAVSVRLPKNSGASVHLASTEGSVAMPEGRSPASTGSSKNVHTQLSGDGPQGTVTVKSRAGFIRLRD